MSVSRLERLRNRFRANLIRCALVAIVGLATAEARADENCGAAGTAIHVIVEGVRSSDGLVTAVLYDDDPENFLKRGRRVDRIRVEAEEGETTLCLEAPKAGAYTIALYHDENGDKKFDRNFIGIPSEGYGFSNNPGFSLGKPSQEGTLFDVGVEPTSIRISVLYL